MSIIEEYKTHTKKREALGVPPLPLTAKQTAELVELLKLDTIPQEKYLKDLLKKHVSPGVDDAAYVKAGFLNAIITGDAHSKVIDKVDAIKLLGRMLGGYNVMPMIEALKNEDVTVAQEACDQLKSTLLVYDSFNDVKDLMDEGNSYAKELIESWANAQWFTKRNPLPKELKLTVFRVPGETNTDDLSPASEAFTRSDIPLHANCMLASKMDNPLETIKELKKKGNPVVYVGDVVGTGSSRKSAINSVQWHIGEEIPGVPNKKTGGVIIGSIIAPIFFNTAEDSGAFPIEADVKELEMGDEIVIKPYEGKIYKNDKVVSQFSITPNTLPDEIQAGGRIPLIIGRNLTSKARAAINLGEDEIFKRPSQPKSDKSGYTLAQKIIAKACGMQSVKPGMYCEPVTSTVGSQDTTGAMTRDEIKELAALSFGADFVMQSFCHTAAYPKPADIELQHTLPEFFQNRGGVVLKPGDGVIHSWLNRFCLPDTLGTGGDSHTRFPIGISFPAGSGLVAFAAVAGSMPLNVPESVLVRFKGEMQPGISLRDMVNAIPYYAIKKGLLTVPKEGKINTFAGKILEIEGLEDLKVEQAFELSDASAERSTAACVVNLNKEPIIEYLESNIAMIEAMIKAGYEDKRTLKRRAEKMREWIANPTLLRADKDAKYSEVLEIDMSEITEPILACPNDPDDVATLSEILSDSTRPNGKIDEVFVGSCMTNIGLFRALGEVLKGEGTVPAKLWIAPPTKMDKKTLTQEGYYSIFGAAGARTEIPGCSLCMGNQARVANDAIVYSTSTRNFDNRMGKGAKVYLGSSELAAVTALLGRLPTKEEYLDIVPKKITPQMRDKIYKYLDFSKLSDEQLKEMFD